MMEICMQAKCRVCDGTGKAPHWIFGIFGMKMSCRVCNGSGKADPEDIWMEQIRQTNPMGRAHEPAGASWIWVEQDDRPQSNDGGGSFVWGLIFGFLLFGR